jgi:hypothetical protein
MNRGPREVRVDDEYVLSVPEVKRDGEHVTCTVRFARIGDSFCPCWGRTFFTVRCYNALGVCTRTYDELWTMFSSDDYTARGATSSKLTFRVPAGTTAITVQTVDERTVGPIPVPAGP